MSYSYDTSGYDTGYSTTGASHAGGGGFLPTNDFPSSQPANGYSQGGGGGPSDTTNKRGNFSLVPLTIKQFYSADYVDDKFRLQGRDMHHFRLVAQVVNVKHTNTGSSIYTVNDGTGEVTCSLYVKDGMEMSMQRVDISDHQYVRVIGYPKVSNNGQRSVGVVDIKLVTDFNEVTYHQIEAAYTALKANAPATQRAAATASASTPLTAYGAPVQQQAAYMNDGSSGMAGVAVPGVGGPSQVVLQAFMHHPSEQGASVREVAERTGLSLAAVRKAVTELSEDGHLYSTIDEDHYKSTTE